MTSGPLSHLGVLRFAGTDAVQFLQGQLSNDTRRLTAGGTLLAAYSSPQGRVVAVLHLLPHSSGILALLPREIVLPTLERLRKFVMRAKVRLEDVSDQMVVAGIHGVDALRSIGLPTTESYAERDGIGIARTGPLAGESRFWVAGPLEKLAHLGLADDAATAPAIENAWRLADVRAGQPQIYAATREMFVAQMLNLDRIDGISFTKGCFTGQEIIARTQHLGRIKRRLFRLRLPSGTWAVGQAITLTDGRNGRLTELATGADGIEALAVLPLTGATAEPGDGDSRAATDGTVDAVEMPLPYDLS